MNKNVMNMTVVTWNVNGLRAVERKGALDDLLRLQPLDLLLVQEIKGKKEQFSTFLTDHTDYAQYYHSADKPGYAGTGIWVRRAWMEKNDIAPTVLAYIPDAPNDDEGRITHVAFPHAGTTYDFLSIYFPNGGKSEQAWREKLIFFDKTLAFMNDLRAAGHVVIVGGDMNVAHTAIDLARPKENDGHIGFHPDERAWMDRVMAAGWVDVWREKNPGVTDVYSYWDPITRARDRNVGWRIDYFFLDQTLLSHVAEIRYMSEQQGSDHCPLMMDVRV